MTPDSTISLRDWFSMLEAAAPRHLFAVLDSARDPNIPIELRRKGAEFVSLYRGEPEESLSSVAPYLVRLDPRSESMRWLLTNGWGNSWGIFLVSSASLEILRRHLRQFLLVHDVAGNELYFRFYDPRVLRTFLPTCTGAETKRFFGPVGIYLMEAEDGEAVSFCSRTAAGTIRVAELNEWSDGALIADGSSVEAAPKLVNRRLRIREEQMNVFSDYMNKSFASRVALYLREGQADATDSMTALELDEFIDAGVDRAARYSLTRENEIGVFLELMLLFGAEFDQITDWAPELLQNQDLSAADKLDRLREHRDSATEIRPGAGV
jgi:Domain of unknown function (DUF4123)